MKIIPTGKHTACPETRQLDPRGQYFSTKFKGQGPMDQSSVQAKRWSRVRNRKITLAEVKL